VAPATIGVGDEWREGPSREEEAEGQEYVRKGKDDGEQQQREQQQRTTTDRINRMNDKSPHRSMGGQITSKTRAYLLNWTVEPDGVHSKGGICEG
jgi:hypothetical protein